MKKIILAVTLAFSSVIAVPAASYADSVIIRTDDGPGRIAAGNVASIVAGITVTVGGELEWSMKITGATRLASPKG
jgi:hypothetical protein